jgi:hypothetical protein
MTGRVCDSCGDRYENPARPGGWRGCRGFCPRCYSRWREHGFPLSGPPAPRKAGRPRGAGGRAEDYADLRSWGLSPAEVALRLGVTRRTVQRWDAAARFREAA